MRKGDEYIIEIAEIKQCTSDAGLPFDLGRVKGFKALTLDESALKKLKPVIRCKDCKYWTGIECTNRDIDIVDDDEYCSYGERKEEE